MFDPSFNKPWSRYYTLWRHQAPPKDILPRAPQNLSAALVLLNDKTINTRVLCHAWLSSASWSLALPNHTAGALSVFTEFTGWTQSVLYISGMLRSSGHRVKSTMVTNGALSYVRFSVPTRSFMFTCHGKTAQGAWNRRNLGLRWPQCLASDFYRSFFNFLSVTERSHLIIVQFPSYENQTR